MQLIFLVDIETFDHDSNLDYHQNETSMIRSQNE